MMNSNLEQTIRLQQKASNPDVSAWVFASAGSGKTKILTDRVLRLLLEGVPPNKILCLTFTKVAATEMQHRINAELAEWILCDDALLNKKLTSLSGHAPTNREIEKARTLFIKILDEEYKIKVQTIHSFCQTLIKIFPFEVNITPTFEVLEVNQEKLLLKQAQQDILKKAANNTELQELIKQTNAKLHEEGFNELIANLLNKKEQLNALKETFFGIENVIAEIFTKFGIAKSHNVEDIFAEFLSRISLEKISDLGLALDTTGLVRNEAISDKLKTFLEDSSFDNFFEFKSAFFTQKNEPRKIYGNILKDENLANLIEDYREIILEFSDKFNSFKIANDTALLLRFIDYILEHYAQLKRSGSFLDYNDLITETNRLLANPDFSDWVKMKMDGTFDHILIDESQDTNHQQWDIIKALSEDFYSGLSSSDNKRSIFIVGDEKQSIYSFQGAEPNISAEIFAYFEERLDGKLHKIELNNSFRSTQTILDAVDQVFSTNNRQDAISKVSEFKAHQAIRQGYGHVEIWPQILKTKAEKTDETKDEKNYEWDINFNKKDEESPEEVLARAIAQRINNWVEGGRILNNKKRPIEYGDFMILLRNRTNHFNRLLTKFLHQYDIPFNSVSRIKFNNSLIIQDLLAAAQFCLLPTDDLNLACLLKSPIFAISEEDLLEICVLKKNDKSTIFEAIQNLPKFASIARELDEMLKKSQQLNCFDFFYFLLHEKNNQKKFLAHFGHESLEILDKFTLTIFDFCQNFSPNLQKLLEFIEKLDLEIPLSSNKGDSVQISTIHSAKGLQAPIVILPDCCYNFNQLLGAKEEISWIELKDLKFPIWCRKKDDENKFLKTHRAKKLEEAKEEYLRILYVAMTRAEDELYVGGFGNSKDPESWYEVIKSSLLTSNLIDEDAFKMELDKISKSVNPSMEDKEVEEILPSKTHYFAANTSSNQINQSQIKGRLIHKILEIIGKNFKADKSWLLDLTQKVIDREEFLDQDVKTEIYDQIALFIDSKQFNEIFDGDVRCEVEIASNKSVSRIDLLIIKEDQVLIIDYKSDEMIPDKMPQNYIEQLEKYRQLVCDIYPEKKILCAVFWTKSLQLSAV